MILEDSCLLIKRKAPALRRSIWRLIRTILLQHVRFITDAGATRKAWQEWSLAGMRTKSKIHCGASPARAQLPARTSFHALSKPINFKEEKYEYKIKEERAPKTSNTGHVHHSCGFVDPVKPRCYRKLADMNFANTLLVLKADPTE